MKPNAKSVTTALRKVADLKFNTLANGHGPIVRSNLEQLVGNYRDWSLAAGKAGVTVAVLYASDYGYSDRLSQTLAKGITKAGVATEMLDLLSADPQEIVMALGGAKGVVLMMPPSDRPEARASLAAVASALKPGTKVGLFFVFLFVLFLFSWGGGVMLSAFIYFPSLSTNHPHPPPASTNKNQKPKKGAAGRVVRRRRRARRHPGVHAGRRRRGDGVGRAARERGARPGDVPGL